MKHSTQPSLLKKLPIGAWIGLFFLSLSVAFFVGMQYQKESDGGFATTPSAIVIITPLPTNPQQQSMISCQTDNDCTLYNPQAANNVTLCCHNQDLLCNKDQSQITAVNKTYYQQQVATICKPHTVCPMYMMTCPSDIQQKIQVLKTVCNQGSCRINQ